MPRWIARPPRPIPLVTHPRALLSISLSALLTLPLPLLSGCGGSGGGGVSVEDSVPEGSTSCVVVEDPTRPYIVEWSGSQIGTLMQESTLGGVVVSYDGCRTLKILNGCHLTGSYRRSPVRPPLLDERRIASEEQLMSALPLAAARLGARLAGAQGIELTTVLTGSATFTAPADGIEVSGEARCAGASHYVEALDLGASSLRQLSADEVAGEVSVGGVGAGGRSAQRLSSFSERGEPAACRRAGFDDEGCQVPWRIQLRRLAELPGGMPAFFA